MGLLYQATKRIPFPPIFQGIHPTTLEELLDKIDRLPRNGNSIDLVEVTPRTYPQLELSETYYDFPELTPSSIVYAIDYVAHLANGRRLEFQEPRIFLLSDDEDREVADAQLRKTVERRIQEIQERGYRAA